jgi:hypothetical protein
MFHVDPESNKAIIRAMLRQSVAKLAKKVYETKRNYKEYERMYNLLTLHERNPREYEAKCEELEVLLEERKYKLDIINEIIRRKGK